MREKVNRPAKDTLIKDISNKKTIIIPFVEVIKSSLCYDL